MILMIANGWCFLRCHTEGSLALTSDQAQTLLGYSHLQVGALDDHHSITWDQVLGSGARCVFVLAPEDIRSQKIGSVRERDTSLFPLSLLRRCHCRENRAQAFLLDLPSVVRQSAWRGKLDLSSTIEPIS
jgi:hypothetical protein